MPLPIRTAVDDVKAICNYLVKKPTGASIAEAKAVIGPKPVDGRKLSAYKYWGIIEDQARLKLTNLGREVVRDNGVHLSQALSGIIKKTLPYAAIIEMAYHKKLESMTAIEVAAHWNDNFNDDVGTGSDKILNDQAVCFFQIATGADLGKLVVGRRSSPTRFEFHYESVSAFIDGQTTVPVAKGGEKDEVQPFADATDAEQAVSSPSPGSTPKLGTAIFLAHGKKKKPLDQLKKILSQFKVPYKVATEEPNLGRPIGSKVKEIMQGCNCAILIFTADEELQDSDGKTIWRPSENVIYELGAASYLYDNRIVIMKEEGVTFPSNFSEIGHISFSKDDLSSKTMDIIQELLGFEIIKVTTEI